MNFYDNFLKINKSAREKHKEQLQAVVNNSFSSAPTYYEDVSEERIMGSMEFIPINVRVNNLVDAKTGQRVNDDFKKIIFEDIYYSPPIGTRYKFDGNIWITFSTDNIKTDTASVYVRRCNNTINIQDEFGNIHREPCYIDYSLTETQVFKEYSIDLARAKIIVYCQLNHFTENININSRFIFGNDAYKVRIRDRFDKRLTNDDKSCHLLRLQLDYDNINEYDNIELSIADYVDYNYKIETVENINNIVGSEGKIETTLLLDNNIVETYKISWISTDDTVASITEDGEYILNRAGSCKFICTLLNNPIFYKEVNVEVKAEQDNVYQNIIKPNISYIRMNETKQYDVYEFLNGKQTDTPFIIEALNAPKDCYIFTSSNNFFVVKNIKISEVPLKISCTNTRDNSVTYFDIKLGGLF